MLVMQVQGEQLRVLIRPACPSDQGYVASTWRESLLLANRETVSTVNARIDKFLDDVGVRVLVAAEPTKPERIYGWMCYSPARTTAVLHYLYTREKQRNRGVAKRLFEYAWPKQPDKIIYTLRGPSSKWLVAKRPDAIYLQADEYLRS